jgi:hypothetical protein
MAGEISGRQVRCSVHVTQSERIPSDHVATGLQQSARKWPRSPQGRLCHSSLVRVCAGPPEARSVGRRLCVLLCVPVNAAGRVPWLAIGRSSSAHQQDSDASTTDKRAHQLLGWSTAVVHNAVRKAAG